MIFTSRDNALNNGNSTLCESAIPIIVNVPPDFVNLNKYENIYLLLGLQCGVYD